MEGKNDAESSDTNASMEGKNDSDANKATTKKVQTEEERKKKNKSSFVWNALLLTRFLCIASHFGLKEVKNLD